MELNADFNETLFKDYARFHEVQIANKDVDPVYPVLRELASILSLTLEERVRLVFLHVAYYDLGSTLAAVDRRYAPFLTAFTNPVPGLKCGTERRRHRMGSNLRDHLSDLARIADQHGGFLPWLQLDPELPEMLECNWAVTTELLLSVNGNGRWAAYKTCEMLHEVCELPLAAPDMGHRGSSGPRQGLALLYPGASVTGSTASVIARLDGYSAQLVQRLQASGLQARMETAETTLCDFHSMVKGNYYPGLDIDVMLEQIGRAPMSRELLSKTLDARHAVLPEVYLGEVAGRWEGPDRQRKSHYKRTGEILVREA